MSELNVCFINNKKDLNRVRGHNYDIIFINNKFKSKNDIPIQCLLRSNGILVTIY